MSAAAHDDTTLDPAVLVIFRTEDLLHRWLDGPQRTQVLHRGQSLGYWARSSDVVLVGGDLAPDGVSVFMQSVAPGREGDFTATQAVLATRSFAFGGTANWMHGCSRPSGPTCCPRCART